MLGLSPAETHREHEQCSAAVMGFAPLTPSYGNGPLCTNPPSMLTMVPLV